MHKQETSRQIRASLKTIVETGTNDPAATPPLVREERLNWIIETLARNGRVLANDLSAQLGVSEDTIRRDLRELAADRRIRRVHGGALPSPPGGLEYSVRERQSVRQKQSIAQAAVKLITPGTLIFLDGGTTNVHVAEAFIPDLQVTVVTNSIPVAAVLANRPAVDVILLGGRVLHSSRVTLGIETVQAIRSFRADLFLLGTCSLDIVAGITVPHLDEAAVKRAMMACSARVVGLVTSEKLGTAMPHVVGSLDDLDALVTEAETDQETLAPFLATGIQVIQEK